MRAVFLDPGERRPLAREVVVVPSDLKTTSASRLSLSGLDHTAHLLAVYASQPESPRHHARLTYDRLPRRSPGLVTRWVPLRVSHWLLSSCLSLPQALPDATSARFSAVLVAARWI